MKIFGILSLFIVLFLSSCSHFASQGDQKLEVGLTCLREDPYCFQTKGVKEEKIWIRKKTNIQLGVEKAFIILDPHSNLLILSIAVDNKKLLFDFTRGYLGHEAYLKFGKEILYYSQIQAEISNGLLLFPMGEGEEREKVLDICKRLDSNCPDEVSQFDFKTNFEGPKLGYVDLDIIEENYNDVKESLMWYSPHEKILVFSDENLETRGQLHSNSPVANRNPKQPLYFVGAQTFEQGKFVYSDRGIKLQSLGYVDRDLVLPGNILRSPSLLKNEFTSFLSFKKCASTYGENTPLPNAFKMVLDSFNKLGAKFLKDSQIGLCAHTGKKECKKIIKRTEEWVQNVQCEKMPLLFSIKDLEPATLKELRNECFEGNKIFSCFILKERYLWKNDKKRLLQVFKQGCKLHNYEMCFYYGLEIKENRDNRYLKESCENGLTSACHQLAYRAYQKGQLKKAKAMYKNNCDNHNYQSCSNLGGIYLSEKKYKTAYPYLEKSCRFNNSTGCYNLACYYSLNENIKSALRKLEKALMLGIRVDDWLKEKDPDLNFIRNTLEFKVMIKNYGDTKSN